MRTLYPEITPYACHRLAVGGRHSLYIEESGRPDGLPTLYLHGGPGAGSEPLHRRYFDPQRHRIVLFDQRGCGRSTPHAELGDNTTALLVADIEAVRERLGIDRWLVAGGSWGSTLGLAYAQAHPERVLGLVLRGVFLCRPEDIAWFYQHGAGRLFPDLWEGFLAPIPEGERDDLVSAYHRRLCGEDEVERLRAAKAWARWEGGTLTLAGNTALAEAFAAPHRALALARIEAHYFVNDSFLEPDQLLRDAGRLAGIPGLIVHGRYDVICPLDGAWALSQAWPDARLEIVQQAGHAGSEPGIVDALVRGIEALAEQLA